MIKRIIFDIDGTLIKNINFEPYINNSLRYYGISDIDKTKIFIDNIKEYEKVNKRYDKKLYLKFFSRKLGVHLDERFLNILFSELSEAYNKDSDKLIEVLSSLSDYDLVLLSNYFEESQRNRLINMRINRFFREYYGEKIIKPNADAYLSAARNCNPNECIIVGDDKKLDIDIPSTLGFNTIYIGSDGDIESVEDISPDLIEKINKRAILEYNYRCPKVTSDTVRGINAHPELYRNLPVNIQLGKIYLDGEFEKRSDEVMKRKLKDK